MGLHSVPMKTITRWIRSWTSNWWPSPRLLGMISCERSSSSICLTSKSQRANKVMTSQSRTTSSTFLLNEGNRINLQSVNTKTLANQRNSQKLSKSSKRQPKTTPAAFFYTALNQTGPICKFNFTRLSEEHKLKCRSTNSKTPSSLHLPLISVPNS